MAKLEDLAERVIAGMRGYVERATSVLGQRIKAVEDWRASIPSVDELRGATGPKGDAGAVGAHGPAVSSAVSHFPPERETPNCRNSAALKTPP